MPGPRAELGSRSSGSWPFSTAATAVSAASSYHRLALGREPGELWTPIYRGHALDSLASLDPDCAERWLGPRMPGFDRRQLRLEHHRVAVARLDDLGLAPDFIKIDVKGRPRDVLLGGTTTLRQRRPVLMIEEAATVTDLLHPLGYRHRAGLFLAGGDQD